MPEHQKQPNRTSEWPLLLIALAAVVSFACAAPKDPAGQNSAGATTTPQAAAQAPAHADPSTEPPKAASSSVTMLSEVEEAVTRVCLDDVTIATSQNQPFIVGDFNGDGSQDLAVIVRPTSRALSKLNSEYANWIVEDPRKVVLPNPNKAVQRLPKPPARVFIQANDLLFLVLHGYQQEGWRHQYARQTFLLKNAVGENVRTRLVNEVARATNHKNSTPQPSGDVIGESLSGHEGFLYWTNGRYAWWE
jgi:hypothetical protein